MPYSIKSRTNSFRTGTILDADGLFSRYLLRPLHGLYPAAIRRPLSAWPLRLVRRLPRSSIHGGKAAPILQPPVVIVRTRQHCVAPRAFVCGVLYEGNHHPPRHHVGWQFSEPPATIARACRVLLQHYKAVRHMCDSPPSLCVRSFWFSVFLLPL